jgi:hypothetical protein
MTIRFARLAYGASLTCLLFPFGPSQASAQQGATLPELTIEGARQQPAASSAIEARLMAEFDRPQARLTVAPIAISGEYAVAGWRQEGRGGRALLHRKGHEWRIVMCAGEALRREPALVQIGLSTEDARVLTAMLAVEEGRLGAAHVAALDSFEGQVTMDGTGHHPPAGSHGAHGSHH